MSTVIKSTIHKSLQKGLQYQIDRASSQPEARPMDMIQTMKKNIDSLVIPEESTVLIELPAQPLGCGLCLYSIATQYCDDTISHHLIIDDPADSRTKLFVRNRRDTPQKIVFSWI